MSVIVLCRNGYLEHNGVMVGVVRPERVVVIGGQPNWVDRPAGVGFGVGTEFLHCAYPTEQLLASHYGHLTL